MGWFDEQIKFRIKHDKELFQNSFYELSSVILGESAINKALNTNKQKAQNAIEEILTYYKQDIIEVPENVEDMNSRLDYMLRPTGIMKRRVKLNDKWWQNAIGPMLGETKKGEPIALIPNGFSGYTFFDYDSMKRCKVDKNTSNLIDKEAFCFYKPFPSKELNILDLIKYIINMISKSDIVILLSITFLVTLLGLFSPYINKIIFNSIIPLGNISNLVSIIVLFIGITISTTLIDISKSLVMARLSSKMSIYVESATMGRVIALPVQFFKDYTSGDLANRTNAVSQLCVMITETILSTSLTALFSVIYIFQIGSFAPQLTAPSIFILVIMLLCTISIGLLQIKISRKQLKVSTTLTGLIFLLFSGIQKIKLSGAERRAFVKWSEQYQKKAKLIYSPPLLIKIQPAISTILSTFGLIIIYYFAVQSNISVANYMAFNVAYGMVSGSVISLSQVILTIASIKPIMEIVEPILKTSPEMNTDKKIITRLSGGIEVNNVTFQYSKDSPIILDNFSLKIKRGQYVAIVGKTGCGKSTLLRLLLGFEKPQTGAIYYDNTDIENVDLASLRKNIGVVMQNGKLFSGDVFSNIIISAPWLSQKDAWEAVKMAGLYDDIKAMPMGMSTLIAEGSGGISGGQKQRLMIARAIAPKPKILMLDEATSALDNITQKIVSDALDSLKCTRIVIAHRLSTIKQCDRIIVLDKGKIIEDGTYEQLISENGFFAELVKRQMVDIPTNIERR